MHPSACITCILETPYPILKDQLKVVRRARQLTELKALLGAVGELRFVLGCISQLQDGRFFLEDLSDAIPLDLSAANTASGFFTGTPNDLLQKPGVCCCRWQKHARGGWVRKLATRFAGVCLPALRISISHLQCHLHVSNPILHILAHRLSRPVTL